MKKVLTFALLSLPLLFAEDGQKKPVKITVGHFSNITHAQAVIGHANGWFDKDLAPEASVDWKIFNAGWMSWAWCLSSAIILRK